MLARPARRATYHRALRSGELIPQNERELRRSQGSASRQGNFHLTSSVEFTVVTGELERNERAWPLSDPRLCPHPSRRRGRGMSRETSLLKPISDPQTEMGLGPLVVRAQTWTLSRTFSRSVWYAFVCNEATVWPAAAYALPFKRDSGA